MLKLLHVWGRFLVQILFNVHLYIYPFVHLSSVLINSYTFILLCIFTFINLTFVNGCVCASMYLYKLTFVLVYICTSMYLYTYIFVQVCICTHIYLYKYVFVHVDTYTFVSLYIHTLVHYYMCTSVYLYIYVNWPLKLEVADGHDGSGTNKTWCLAQTYILKFLGFSDFWNIIRNGCDCSAWPKLKIKIGLKTAPTNPPPSQKC